MPLTQDRFKVQLGTGPSAETVFIEGQASPTGNPPFWVGQLVCLRHANGMTLCKVVAFHAESDTPIMSHVQDLPLFMAVYPHGLAPALAEKAR
jgi:hypothetical protein